jgi:hypothetical protein
MTDGWTDSNGRPLTPADEWSSGCGCAPPDGPAIANSVTIVGSPGAITSVQNDKSLWALVLNDGTPAADFRIDRFDDTGALASSPMSIQRATGVVSFHDPVMLAADPLEDMEAATKLYVDEHASGIPEAPIDSTTYGRDNGAWVALPASYMPEAPNTSTRFGRFNSTWQPDAIQTDAPNDGGAYARQSGAWTAAVTGGPYLPLAGGTIAGALNLPPNNQVYINGPLNSTTNIIGQRSGNLVRWSMALGDSATEGAGNSGCNFRLDAYGAAGAYLGTPLTISRNGDFNLTGSVAINGMFALQGPGYFNLPGGSAGQVLSTNGAGLLSWIAPVAGVAEAPNDGTAYARKSAAWSHITHTDIADWTATLAPYALTASVPVASTTTPLADGVAAVGTSTAYARADHVHPNIAMNDNRIINGDMRIDQRNNGASGTANGYTVDRWKYGTNQAGKGSWQRWPATPVLAALGFGYSLGFTSSSAYASLAGDAFSFLQAIEADMVSDFAWGTASAQPVTLSFWVNVSIAGTYSGCICNYTGGPSTRSYPFSFSIPTGWSKIVLQIPGDTAGTWTMSGNGGALYLIFDLGSGANFRGAATGAWQNANLNGVTGTVSVVATNGATFYVTGVKLEIGNVATPFNRQSLAKSMADCQRYFETSYPDGTSPGAITASFGGQVYIGGLPNAGYNAGFWCTFQTRKRTTPTVTLYSPNTGASGKIYSNPTAVDVAGVVSGQGLSGFNASAAGLPTAITVNLCAAFTASAEL